MYLADLIIPATEEATVITVHILYSRRRTSMAAIQFQLPWNWQRGS